MGNIKVKVNNDIDGLVSLFSDLGCKYFNHTVNEKNYMIYQNGKCFFVKSKKDFNVFDCKELTIPQLRDLVVLKRNDVGDCTHWHIISKANFPYFLSSGGEWYFFGRNGWEESTHNQDFYSRLKPIEKDMSVLVKEYLDKDYVLRLVKQTSGNNRVPANWIEVPQGATHYSSGRFKESKKVFIKLDGSDQYEFYNGEWLLRGNPLSESYFNEFLLWQRHTKPEELTFVDDELKIETATGYQLDVVGQGIYGSRGRNDGESDMSYRQYLMNFTFINKIKHLNTDHAAIDNVRSGEIKFDFNQPIETVDDEPKGMNKGLQGLAQASKKLSDKIESNLDKPNASTHGLSKWFGEKHSHYKKDVSNLSVIDVYRVLDLFEVDSHVLGHAIKKLLCSGKRGAKDADKDIQEAIDSLVRYQEMKKEDLK